MAMALVLVRAPALASVHGLEIPPQKHWSDHGADQVWLQIYDPTLINRRMLTQLEWEESAGGGFAQWLWNLRWSAPLDDNLALGMQVETPFRWDGENSDGEFGLGDIETRVALVRRMGQSTRLGGALHTKFSSATSSGLGNGIFELRPMLLWRTEVSSMVQLGMNVEYHFTPRDEGDARVSNFELKLPASLRFADDFSGFVSYNPRLNEVNETWRHRLELGLTCHFGRESRYALSVGMELPLVDEQFEFKGMLGLSLSL